MRTSSPLFMLVAGLALTASSLACNVLAIDAPPGTVLFQDDFSRPNSGWDRYRDDAYQADYQDGAYVITIFQPRIDAWANPGLSLSDIRVEVNATKLAGPDDNVFGLLCRYQDPKNYYYFLVSSDGYAGVGLTKDGRRRLLSGEALLPSEAVIQGQATNHLRADCAGFRLTFYVNGVLVGEVQTAEWMEGDVGLLAGSYDEPGTTIAFDNFSVSRPELDNEP
jgi:hypothetical protein